MAIAQYTLLAVLWSVYCAVHSLLISPPFLRWVQQRFPSGHRFHRLFFNIFSILTLIPIVAYSLRLQSTALFQWSGSLRFIQVLLLLAGGLLLVAGARAYDAREFLGLAQLSRPDACRSIGTECEINTRGVLGLLRHPWYSAAFFLLWARDLDPAAIVTNAVLTVYVIIGAHLEELKLVTTYGQAYREYQRAVSMFLPVRWLKDIVLRHRGGYPH